MQTRKKKISFDVDPKILKNIHTFCEENNIKVSDFYRNSLEHYYFLNKDFYEIYVIDNFQIKYFTIKKDYFDVREIAKTDENIMLVTKFKKLVEINLKFDVSIDKIENKELIEILEKNNNKVKAYMECF